MFLSLLLIWFVSLVGGISLGMLVKKVAGPGKVSRTLLDVFYKGTFLKMMGVLIAGATFEELVFRFGLIGIPHHFFGGLVFWIAFSSVAFSLMHLSNFKDANAPLLRVLPHIFLGLVFAYVYITYGLLAVILLHFAYNLTLGSMARTAGKLIPGFTERTYANAS